MSNTRVLAAAEKLAEGLVSLSAAARIAGVTRQAITQHVERGHIASVQVGSNRFVTLQDVGKLITEYAMTGRRPKHKGAVAERKRVMDSIGDKAERLVHNLVEVIRRRDTAIATIKERYAERISRESDQVERRKLRSQRDRMIAATKAEHQKRLDRLHAIRENLLEKNGW